MSKVLLHAIVHGHVQGVFFRDTTLRWAQEVELSGTVKNLFDGTVEIYAVGERAVLEGLLKRLTSAEGPGKVSFVEAVYKESNQSYDGFQILY